ncbi:MAG: hypothetical protein HYZ81_23020 [Nitrospinae bacterium]|nr:hypothetical protein [Nitrospinota bacterium]
MRDGHDATGTRRKWMGMSVLLAVLLVASAVPGHTWQGMGGFRGTHHRFRHARVFITGSFVVPFGPVWALYAYPPVVVAPPAPVYVQPSAPPPPPYWYACDDPQGYYPYVQQCPGGWRQVSPTPP